MKEAGKRPVVEIVVTACLLLVGLVVLASTVIRYEDRRQVYAESIQPGELLDPSLDLHLASNENTLVLALTNDCVYCNDSAPFYRRLAELHEDGHISADLLVVMPKTRDLSDRYLRINEIDVRLRAGISLDQLGIAGSPTLLLTDPRGRILEVWIGRLDAAGESDVLQTIRVPGDG